MEKLMRYPIAWSLAAVLGLGAMTAEAADVSLSGFGTLGYAQSNQPYNFEQFINNNGTIKSNSLVGVQADIKFTNQIGATVQGKLAPFLSKDTGLELTMVWAFLSWRPSDDLLVRAGKQRLPLFLHSETLDVGASYDFARLPQEVYLLIPTQDYVGASISKTWDSNLGELTADIFAGTASQWARTNISNTAPGMPPLGPAFLLVEFAPKGLMLNLRRDEDIYHVGIMQEKATQPTQAIPSSYVLTPAAEFPGGLPPGSSGSVYLPGAIVNSWIARSFALGAEIHLPHDFRLTGEWGRRQFVNMQSGLNTDAGYLALLKDVGQWTPYVSYSAIKSGDDMLRLYQHLRSSANGVSTPAAPQVAAGINATQPAMAGLLMAHDHNTVALGTSYRVTPNQKVKLEWARTHIGVAPGLFVDTPPGGNVSNQNINVLTFSYNFVF